MPSFGEGFAEGLNSSLKQEVSSNLQLKMLSKQIEMQQQARMAEAEQSHKFSLISGTQGRAALKTLGVSDDKLDLLEKSFPDGMPESVLGNLTQSLGMQARANAIMNKPTHIVTKPDANNLVTAGFQSPMTGEWLGQPQTTLNPQDQLELNKVQAATDKGMATVNGVLQRAQQVLPQLPSGVPLNKLEAYFTSHGMPYNPELKAFVDSVPQIAGQFIKDTTGMAPRSMELMHLDMNAFPGLGDDGPSAIQKASIIQSNLKNGAMAAFQAYDPTNYTRGKYHPMTIGAQIGQQSADANQLHTTGKGVKYIVSQ